jgi:hypothetical protein
MESMRPIAIVAGYFVGFPVGGHVMSILHWLAGLRQLGFDVVFAEQYEWGSGCWNPITAQAGDDPSYGIGVLRRHLEELGISHWCFVDAAGTYHGLSRHELQALCARSEVLIGLWTVTWLEEFLECRRRVFIDTDPGFTQFSMSPAPAPPGAGYASPIAFHEHFTYGTRIGRADCPIPTHGIDWQPTRPPVCLDLLPPRFTPDAPCFTTVMSWTSRAAVVYEGVEYGQKDVEFWRIADLPSRVGQCLEIALAKAAPRDRITAAGWRLADAGQVTATTATYRDYIARSRGEFSVAVNLEVKTRSGWFSDRTAAYLASGKPVVVQDTGFSEDLPCGEGLFAFRTIDDAAAAIEEIARDYPRHCAAARRIAEEYFDVRRILGSIVGMRSRTACGS